MAYTIPQNLLPRLPTGFASYLQEHNEIDDITNLRTYYPELDHAINRFSTYDISDINAVTNALCRRYTLNIATANKDTYLWTLPLAQHQVSIITNFPNTNQVTYSGSNSTIVPVDPLIDEDWETLVECDCDWVFEDFILMYKLFPAELDNLAQKACMDYDYGTSSNQERLNALKLFLTLYGGKINFTTGPDEFFEEEGFCYPEAVELVKQYSSQPFTF